LDNAGLMFISLLIRLGVKKVELAGFDGFKYDSKDYLEFVSGSYMQKDLDYRNEKISVELWRFSQYIDIDYLTPTMYNMDVKNE
jgi:4-hydroxy 2-oxovalerate aldolase